MPLRRLREINTRDCLWTYVLRILEDGPMHAYAIRSEIEKRFGFKPGNVTSYKVIYLLSRSGFVSKRKEGRKVVYAITKRGRESLKGAVDFYKERIRLLSKAR
jgi:DNA-binding PadR family transcriptional regulator